MTAVATASPTTTPTLAPTTASADIITTIAGDGSSSFTGDGVAVTAGLNGPYRVTLDAAGIQAYYSR